MTSISPHESSEAQQVPADIVIGLQEELATELDQIVAFLPDARSTIETQWAEGIKQARVAIERENPLNSHAAKVASTLKRWMELDYGEGMVTISYWSHPGDLSDDIIAINNLALRKARLAAGAVDISKSALETALEYTRDGKDQAIDDQDFEAAATWRDQQKNVIQALGGLGLVPPED